MPELAWTARGSSAALRAVRSLINAHARLRPVEVVKEEGRGSVAFSACGVTGTVPEDARLRHFAEAAAAVCARGGGAGPVALLAQWDERAFQAAKHFGSLAPAPLFWLPAQSPAAIFRRPWESVSGRACIFGHGHTGGWDGYWGLNAPTLAAAATEPMGGVLSLTCMAGKRPERGFPAIVQRRSAASDAPATVGTRYWAWPFAGRCGIMKRSPVSSRIATRAGSQ